MGLEVKCRAQWNGEAGEGKLQLEVGELRFRGAFRLNLPTNQAKVEARDGQLVVTSPLGEGVFEIGPAASKWALQIQNPKGRLDKLGVKAGSRVMVAGVTDRDFHEELRARNVEVVVGGPAAILFYAAEESSALARLAALESSIERNGAIWIVYPKGRKDITENQVLAAIRAANFVDTKVCAFSSTHTALKAMIPVARR
ncbi:MAG: DUF3052 domain-containing protein [Bryobacteraceae bacterium]